ncbi:STAS-like domain-containing protein [Hydrogenophaga sp.]|uniref:STAS-like domain-containing protein n=1 Tax=Hydrogenophaga sp. TaxID=1904254 RepID=UPI003D0DFA08
MQSFKITPDLAEHEVWEQFVEPMVRMLPTNVKGIWNHAFTEMFNNAIDHSGSPHALVTIERTAASTSIHIDDEGVGIFKKLKQELDLESESHAIFELSKGKLTTDPKNHSGEGIFFTSRMLDLFTIMSGELYFSHRHDFSNDWLLDMGKPTSGTTVSMALNNHSSRTTRKVFDQYSGTDGDYGFNKTVIPVALAQYGEDALVSRSQAKRVLARVNLFERVVFDFEGVREIGQSFADQIFRVYASEHPGIELTCINASPAVDAMIRRAKSGKTDRPPERPVN